MPREVIVPGVRDLIPPQGRVTVQLTNPETGRVRHEVRAENMLMNSWLAQVNVHARGALDRDNSRNQYLPNFSPVAANSDAGFAREHVWAHLGRPGIWPSLYSGYMPWLWASDKNIAPDPDRTCPPCTTISNGNFTGHARLDLAHTSIAGRLNRGTSIASESWHKWDQSRVTVEFGSVEANGTYRSIGVGRIASHVDENRCISSPIGCDALVTLRQADSQQMSIGSDIFGLGSALLRSGAFEDSNHFWCSSGANNLYVYDWETDTLTTGPSTGSVTGAGQIGVAIQGGYLWLSRGANIMKCSKYTGGALTILNTYDQTASLAGQTFWDLTSDGTSLYALTATKVFVINPTDGTVTTSWLHGLTHSDISTCNNVEWDPANQLLWIYFGTDEEPPYHNNDPTTQTWQWSNDYGHYSNRAENMRGFGFSTAGVQLPYSFLTFVWGYRHFARGFTGIDPNGWIGMLVNQNNNSGTYSQTPVHLGGMIGSHALLPSDVVKTAADGLKIRYDFDFA
jgi:hypothetical protein